MKQHTRLLLLLGATLIGGCSAGGDGRRSNGDDGDLSIASLADLASTVSDLAAPDDLAVASASPDLLAVPDDLPSTKSDQATVGDLKVASTDLLTAPVDLALAPSNADLAWVFGVDPYIKDLDMDYRLFPDHAILGSLHVMPGTSGAVITKVELIDEKNRIYKTLWKSTTKFGFNLSWDDVNAVEPINTKASKKLWFRLTAIDGKQYLESLPKSIDFECVNAVDACNGQCGDCPGYTFTACRTGWKTSDSCYTYCKSLGKVCSPYCEYYTFHYTLDSCDSEFSGTSYYRIHSSCLTEFGNLTDASTDDMNTVGISCCCQ